MDPLHASLPMVAAWMGGALLSLASAGLKQGAGIRTRRAARDAGTVAGAPAPQTAAVSRG
ncbi:MAG: hypothetical protein JWM27_3349 [Gemmatimonadetes bacterium]|nr:hypothetical protein [Gemmatimonadota bacterium]